MPVMRYRSPLTGTEVWEGDSRVVAAQMPRASCSLAILDGAYGLGKSKAWDGVKVEDLPEWYRPFLEDAGRVLGPSASLYVWNTAEGWARLDPLIRSMGWTFRALVTWVKDNPQSLKSAYDGGARTWPDMTEVCGFYQRVAITQDCGLIAANVPDATAARALGCDSRLPALWRGWPHVHGSCWPTKAQFMRYARLLPRVRAAEIWRKRRPPAFTCPLEVGNVWTHKPVTGPARLRAPDGGTLHPCQKPLAFAERILRASSRPGESVWVPFGGTLREAVAAERIARADPGEARRVITAELNQDGVDYIGPALRQLRGEGTQRRDPRQGELFGGAA